MWCSFNEGNCRNWWLICLNCWQLSPLESCSWYSAPYFSVFIFRWIEVNVRQKVYPVRLHFYPESAENWQCVDDVNKNDCGKTTPEKEKTEKIKKEDFYKEWKDRTTCLQNSSPCLNCDWNRLLICPENRSPGAWSTRCVAEYGYCFQHPRNQRCVGCLTAWQTSRYIWAQIDSFLQLIGSREQQLRSHHSSHKGNDRSFQVILISILLLEARNRIWQQHSNGPISRFRYFFVMQMCFHLTLHVRQRCSKGVPHLFIADELLRDVYWLQ